jgi:hypothetical protein
LFTGELLALLRGGVSDGPELLTFGEIYRRLLHTATAKGLPLPGQRGTGTVDLLALSRNVAVMAKPRPAAPPPPAPGSSSPSAHATSAPPRAAGHPGPTWRQHLLGKLGLSPARRVLLATVLAVAAVVLPAVPRLTQEGSEELFTALFFLGVFTALAGIILERRLWPTLIALLYVGFANLLVPMIGLAIAAVVGIGLWWRRKAEPSRRTY